MEKKKASRFSPVVLAYLGVLIAADIILSRFLSFNAWNLKIGFSFLPVALGGILFGPLGGAIVGAVGDFLGAILFPIGAYFPGFTATAFVSGLVYGWMLYRERSWTRTIIAAGIHQLVLGLLVNTAWISVLYGSAYFPTLVSRLPQCGALLVIEVVVIKGILPLVDQFKKRIGL